MKRKLPPLHALRVFEAAGRHLSFTLAASELHLTQGAVSRQVRVLEDFVQKPLFRRLTRKVELTDAGQELLQSADLAFASIERSVERVNEVSVRKSISLSIVPTLASLWLMPRLASFTEAFKTIEVRLVTSVEPAPFGRGSVDVAVACGALPGKRYDKLQPRIDLQMVDDWKGVRATPLFPDRLVPVLSKRLASQTEPMKRVADLRKQRLIHIATRATAWPDWLRANKAEWRSSEEDLEFGHFFMAMQAAREGKGIAIVPTVLLSQYEGREDLVTPFEPSVASAGEYYLLSSEKSEDDPHIRTFRNWLLTQASEISEAA